MVIVKAANTKILNAICKQWLCVCYVAVVVNMHTWRWSSWFWEFRDSLDRVLGLCLQHSSAYSLSCVQLCKPMDGGPPGSSVRGFFSGRNTGVGCYFQLQGIFLTQGSNPGLLCVLIKINGNEWYLAPIILPPEQIWELPFFLLSYVLCDLLICELKW